MHKIKLDKNQRARANELYEYMSDDDNILEDVAQDLIYTRDRARKAEERVIFLGEMLDDYDIVCDQCKYATALKFTDRMRVIMKEKEKNNVKET